MKTDELFNFLSQLELAQRSVKSLSSELEGIASEAAAAADELRRRVSGSNCPTCGGPLDADRVLACALLEAGGLVHDRP